MERRRPARPIGSGLSPMFQAPLAPHLAALAEGCRLDARSTPQGIEYWRERSDVLLVEGVGGLMSPLGEDEYVADLADEFGFPLVSWSRETYWGRSIRPYRR